MHHSPSFLQDCSKRQSPATSLQIYERNDGNDEDNNSNNTGNWCCQLPLNRNIFSWHWLVLWNVLLFLWKLDSKNSYQTLRSLRARRFQENHYPRSTKSRVNKGAQNPPKEENSCTLPAGKLCLPSNAALVTLSWNCWICQAQAPGQKWQSHHRAKGWVRITLDQG